MQVVILAAGMGTRLGLDIPKPLVELCDGKAILDFQMAAIEMHFKRKQISLVVGFRKEEIQKRYPDVRYFHNADYDVTNTAKSLLCAVSQFDDDVLWMNGDVFFEPGVLQLLLDNQSHSSRLLVDRSRVSDEEIKYTLTDDGLIRELSKEVKNACGESLGIQIILRNELPEFVSSLRAVKDKDYFEKAIERCINNHTLRMTPVDVERLYCKEIDFPEDMEAVRENLSRSRSNG